MVRDRFFNEKMLGSGLGIARELVIRSFGKSRGSSKCRGFVVGGERVERW